MKNVLSYKKPAFWIIIAAILVCAAVAVFLLTSPKNDAAGASQSESASDSAESSTVADTESKAAADTESKATVDAESEAVGDSGNDPSGNAGKGAAADVDAPKEVWYCEAPIVDSVYNDRAVLTLYPESKHYEFDPGLISDYHGSGEYTDDGSTVVCSDGTYTYTFTRTNGALEYDKSRSDGPTVGPLHDGTLFRRDLFADPIYSLYDTATFDINGDGTDERVGIGMGMTSGVFSFTVNATAADGEYVCGGTFVTRHYVSLRFAEADGKRVIEATDSDGKTDVIHFKADGTVIVLTDENGTPLEELFKSTP